MNDSGRPTHMRDHPAQHFLRIYQLRLRMAEDGVTSPAPEIVAQVRRLVAGLSAVKPETPVRLEMGGRQARFVVAATGELLGELDRAATD